jgi:hypothetical protein
VAPTGSGCQSSIVKVGYQLQFSNSSHGFVVTNAVLHNLDGACGGASASVSLTQNGTTVASGGPVTISGSSANVSMSPQPLASIVNDVEVDITSGSQTFSGNFSCSSTFPPAGSTITGNLTVPGGVVCTLNNVTVGGNIDDKSGGSLLMHGGSTGGNIDAKGSPELVLDQAASVGGKVKAEDTGKLGIQNASIGGNLDVKHTTGSESPRNYICGSTIGGNITLTDSTSSAPFAVGGPNPPCSSGNSVNGNGSFKNNLAALTVANNAFGGNLDCSGNTSITTSNNTAKKKSGQC